MSGPLSRENLVTNLATHMAEATGVSPEDGEALAVLVANAEHALEYLSGAVRGAAPGAASGLLWVLFSAMWEGLLPQEEIDSFFGAVAVDFSKLYRAWKTAGVKGPMTVALIPGSITEADIASVIQALWVQKGKPTG